MQHTERLQTTACPPNYRFTGYEYDSETGLNYAFTRYYSPRLGRFLSTDL
jgi:RHS repeat-associated protein